MVRVSTSPSLPHDEPVCQDAERARAAGLGSLVGVTWGQWDESLRGLREHAGTRPHKAVTTLPREWKVFMTWAACMPGVDGRRRTPSGPIFP